MMGNIYFPSVTEILLGIAFIFVVGALCGGILVYVL